MIDWQQIDTVLLDMDGTLLDLHFDNFFWLSYLPEQYALAESITIEDSKIELRQRYQHQSGQLNWYCLDFWSKELGLDILALKEDIQHLIAYRPNVKQFLLALKTRGTKRILVTNAHPHSLQLKLKKTDLHLHLDQLYSAHQFNKPKENIQFWHDFTSAEPFDLERTLLIDDSKAVLDNAQTFGFKHLLSIQQPDSRQKPKPCGDYRAINCFSEIMPQAKTT